MECYLILAICQIVGQIPVLSINYTVISNGTSFSRDTVELCIREILVAFGKALGACKDISLDFPKIGRLMIRDKKCRMRFFKEFISSMDSSGKIKYAFVSTFICKCTCTYYYILVLYICYNFIISLSCIHVVFQ